MRHFIVVVACVVSVLVLSAGSRALAGSVTQTYEYQFGLLPQVPASEPVPLVGEAYQLYLGGTTFDFDPFNLSLGQLVGVRLDLSMTITGEVHVYQVNYLYGPTPLAEPYDGLDLTFYGSAEAGSLLAEADFGDYVVGVDGFPTQQGLLVDESGAGSDSTGDPLDFAAFIGGPVNTQVLAFLSLDYLLGEVGVAQQVVAFGQVGLTYTYDEPTTHVVPSPAALPAGLGVLAVSLLRRRRAKG